MGHETISQSIGDKEKSRKKRPRKLLYLSYLSCFYQQLIPKFNVDFLNLVRWVFKEIRSKILSWSAAVLELVINKKGTLSSNNKYPPPPISPGSAEAFHSVMSRANSFNNFSLGNCCPNSTMYQMSVEHFKDSTFLLSQVLEYLSKKGWCQIDSISWDMEENWR